MALKFTIFPRFRPCGFVAQALELISHFGRRMLSRIRQRFIQLLQRLLNGCDGLFQVLVGRIKAFYDAVRQCVRGQGFADLIRRGKDVSEFESIAIQ